jgi:hypothetical protein
MIMTQTSQHAGNPSACRDESVMIIAKWGVRRHSGAKAQRLRAPNASSRPSPRKLNATTVSTIAKPAG